MAIRCIIVEDQLPAQRILERYISDVTDLELTATFRDPLQALAYLREQRTDLIFLDIHLPKISGMEFLKLIPYKAKIILTTAFSEYALEGYEYDAVDYLLKPISFERFFKAVSKILYPDEGMAKTILKTDDIPPDTPAPGSIFVKSDRTILKLELEHIIYIKSEDDYTWVFTEAKNHFLSYSLKYWEEALPSGKFCRIHKSYMINMDYVNKIEGNQVYLSTEKKALPIGRSFKEGFMSRIDLKE